MSIREDKVSTGMLNLAYCFTKLENEFRIIHNNILLIDHSLNKTRDVIMENYSFTEKGPFHVDDL